VCLQAKKPENVFFGDFRPPVENAHFIGTFHMFPDSISFFGVPENGQKWGKIGFLDFLIIFYNISVYRHFLTTIRILSQHGRFAEINQLAEFANNIFVGKISNVSRQG
jgi:hypothetical protein